MNKLSKLMMGLAALSFAACSSDEPTPAPTPDNGEGTTMYLKVRIKSADMGSRADNVNSPNDEWKYDWGTMDEHSVQTADFFFFDEAGVYVTQANVWNEGADNKDDENIEYISNNVIVLKGLTEKQTPKYMITVLNAPENLASDMLTGVSKIADFRKRFCDFTELSTTKNGETTNYFVMTTSTYYDATEGFEDGTTMLEPGMLVEQKENADGSITDIDKLKPVDVYVERLAAKYTMEGAGKTSTIQINVSSFGNENGEGDNTGEAYEEVQLTITGFGITNTADKSYLLKNIEGFNATTPWGAGEVESWNKPEYNRSFWAKSYYYDETDATGLNAATVGSINGNIGTAVYSNENTKPFAVLQGTDNKVKQNLTTNVVFTASITKDGEALKLVNFNGQYFKESQFVDYVLYRLNATSKLNYYKQVSATTTTDEEGTIIDGEWKYVQVGPADVIPSRPDDKVKDAHMTLSLNSDIKKLYKFNGEDAPAGKKFTEIENGISELQTVINELLSKNGYPTRYNGVTYYVIPIQHLLGKDNDYTVTKDGEFGIVRNHWYNFKVNKFLNMGEGTFNPNEGEDGDKVDPDPDPKKKYALAARINILSWKIVKQNIDL